MKNNAIIAILLFASSATTVIFAFNTKPAASNINYLLVIAALITLTIAIIFARKAFKEYRHPHNQRIKKLKSIFTTKTTPYLYACPEFDGISNVELSNTLFLQFQHARNGFNQFLNFHGNSKRSDEIKLLKMTEDLTLQSIEIIDRLSAKKSDYAIRLPTSEEINHLQSTAKHMKDFLFTCENERLYPPTQPRLEDLVKAQ